MPGAFHLLDEQRGALVPTVVDCLSAGPHPRVNQSAVHLVFKPNATCVCLSSRTACIDNEHTRTWTSLAYWTAGSPNFYTDFDDAYDCMDLREAEIVSEGKVCDKGFSHGVTRGHFMG